jgi:signal transduction histidine kinase
VYTRGPITDGKGSGGTMQNVPFKLDDVVINAELRCRPSRPPDYKAERDALMVLSHTMADAPQMVLKKLVETALHLCRAETAGISLLENHAGEEEVSEQALTGARRSSTMLRHASPWRTTMNRNTKQRRAERVFPALKLVPPVVEALVTPFHVEGKPIGTLWVVAHKEHRKFDCEDERNIRTLAQFASAAWQLWNARATAETAVESEHERSSELATANQWSQFQASERERAEEDLRKLIEELEARVEERTSDLATANAALSRTLEEGRRLQEQLRQAQKMESIGTLAGGLAHDFINFLNIIQGYASTIMRHPADPEMVIEDVQVIRETVEEGAALAQLLLTIGRKTEVKFELTNISTLLQRLTKLLTGTFPERVMISLELDPEVPTVKVDANQVNQALLNLCVNARDAMPDGGNLFLRTRTISGAELGTRCHEAKAERYVWISVVDTGLGMTEEIKSRAFEPFFTTKEPGQGTGLGLSVVHGIISNQNGFIDVTSEPGRGSAFHMYLPIPKDQAPFVEITTRGEEG